MIVRREERTQVNVDIVTVAGVPYRCPFTFAFYVPPLYTVYISYVFSLCLQFDAPFVHILV